MDVESFINDYNTTYKNLKNLEVYSTNKVELRLNAEDMINNEIENIMCNEGYEDWSDFIQEEITQDDVDKIQMVFNEIFNRNPNRNISYETDEQIEIDL